MPKAETATERTLHELRVLDLSTQYAGALVGMHLADHGADVVWVDRPDALRATFAHRGKAHVRPSRDQLDALISRADLVIEDAPVPELVAREALSDEESGQIHVWLPPFEAGHPLEDIRGPDGLLEAFMGLHEVPLGRQPHYHSLSLLSVTAAAYALSGALGALLSRRRDGRGQRVTVARADVAYAILELNAMFTLGPPRSWATLQWAATPFIGGYEAQDGQWIYIHAGLPKHLPRLLKALEPDAPKLARKLRQSISDATLTDPTSVASVSEVRAIRNRLGEIFAIRPAIVWERRLTRAGLCAMAVRSPEAWLRHEHARASGQVVECDGAIMPGVFAEVPQARGVARGSRDVDAAHLLDQSWPERTPPRLDSPPDHRPPLDGVHILDLTQVIAGPTAGRTLAELGARVHRVENPTFRAPWVEAFHIAYNAGKTSETIDLTSAQGRETFNQLLDAFAPDVLLQNLRPGAAEALGLGEEEIRRKTTSLKVYAHLTAYGTQGPWGDRPGWEQTAQAACGIQSQWGGPSSPDLFPLPLNDLCTGVHGACAVMLGLLREQPGKVETNLSMTATLMQARALCDPEPRATGKGELGAAAHRRFYRARDGWMFVWAKTPEALGDVRGLEKLRGSSGVALTLALETELRRHSIVEWRRRALATQGAVFVVPRRTQREVLKDPRAARRGLVKRRTHEGVGPVTETASALVLEHTPTVELKPAPHVERDETRRNTLSWAAAQLRGVLSLASS